MHGQGFSSMCVAFTLLAVKALGGELELSITPMKKAYCLGEPIGVSVTLKNGTAKDIEILSEYPYGRYDLTRTTIKGEYVYPEPDLEWEKEWEKRNRSWDVYIGRGPLMRTLAPGSEFHGIVYINKQFPFIKADTYRMKLRGRYFWVSDIEPVRSDSTFEIQVVPGEFTEEDLKSMLKQWREDNEQVASELISALSCVRQEFVCKYLLRCGRESPGCGVEVAKALAKFAETDEGKTNLEAMGAVFPNDEKCLSEGYRVSKEGMWGVIILEQILEVFASKKAMPSDKFLREQLACPYALRKWAVLHFLEDHGLPGKVPLDAIEPLLHDENKELAKQAQKVLDKFAKKQPAKDKEGQ